MGMMAEARITRMVAVATSSRYVTPASAARRPPGSTRGKRPPFGAEVRGELDLERGAAFPAAVQRDAVHGDEVLGALDAVQEAHELIVRSFEGQRDLDPHEP